jgi:hypothetical protein
MLGCIWALALCPAARAQFAGGTGEPNDPYRIATAAQLAVIGTDPNLLRKHYVLIASIDMGGPDRATAEIPPFSGTFDGDGYVLRNLRLDDGSLFGVISDDGEVRNLGLVDVRATPGRLEVGALAACNWGRVVNCYSTGTILGDSPGAGGLVGLNVGTVADCYSTAAVGGTNSVGGLVGENAGTVSSCHASGDVSGDSWVGGLAGENWGKIVWSHSTGTVTCFVRAGGGLVGQNLSGEIVSCYADATIIGEHDYIGGLVGLNHGLVSSCYSIGSMTGEERVGGLVGYNMGAIRTSYSAVAVRSWGWNVGGLVGLGDAPKNCYFLDASEGGGLDNNVGTPLTGDQMRQRASFVDWDFWGATDDGVNDYWFMPVAAFPVLAWQTDITGLKMIPELPGLSLEQAQAALAAAGFVMGEITYDFHETLAGGHVISNSPRFLAPVGSAVDLVVTLEQDYDWGANAGDGTPARPYQIETAGQLESLAAHPELWNKRFMLTSDLDMIGRTYATALIAPDTDGSKTGFQGTSFSGTFDGQGHTISNLTIHTDTRHDYVGLFGMIAQVGRVDSFTLQDADVRGGSGSSSYVGALAGYNSGTVTNCSATGIVHGGKGDGMVGFNDGSLIDCHADLIRM